MSTLAPRPPSAVENPISRQEAYERVLLHLAGMKRQSLKPSRDGVGEKCAYRSPDGSKCAIGALVPDHLYNPEWDECEMGVNQPGVMSLMRQLIKSPGYDPLARLSNLLGELQRLHDNLANWGPDGFDNWDLAILTAERNSIPVPTISVTKTHVTINGKKVSRA